MPEAENVAYTDLELVFHQDLLYYESTPGVQLLHSLIFEDGIKGGFTTFVDGFKVALELSKVDPQAYRVLQRVPLTYQYRSDDAHLVYKRPVLRMNELTGMIEQINYSPQYQGPLDVPEEDVELVYDAFRKFAEVCNNDDLVYQRRLTPGTMAIFNNRRILHGRTSFDSGRGKRHFQGTYVEWDEFESLYRTMSRKFEG
eukprot:TRINITY_DN4493_c0_g1_i1.p1 TRINITY_DN4493_c0_g1~~TRINITY_DN4493_c0_g1_i1.p1  ORF type:complete len:199 (-),score=64.29 TRINITY_DN4493_c0_g1_i1:142-738(-)